MATAMARGWASADGGPEAMAFADAGSGRAARLAAEVGGEAVGDVGELLERSDAIVLAVKRTALDEVARELGGRAAAGRAAAAGGAEEGVTPLVSVLAGVPLARVQEAFPGVPVLRVMPNLAVEVRRGVLCFVPPGDEFPKDVAGLLVEVLGLLGTLVAVEDERVDAAMAVMSCSPAYLALVSEALARAGADEGLDPKLAHALVVDTLAGTAELLRARDLESIRRAVASPGGATEAGLEALEERGLSRALEHAVRVSLERMRR